MTATLFICVHGRISVSWLSVLQVQYIIWYIYQHEVNCSLLLTGGQLWFAVCPGFATRCPLYTVLLHSATEPVSQLP